MTKTRTNSPSRKTLRAHAWGVLLVLGAAAAAATTGIASCGNQAYYESNAAARTAYEAAESARRAADAATVAAIELRLSNDRLGESADKLREVISSDDFHRRVTVQVEAHAQPDSPPENNPPVNNQPAGGPTAIDVPPGTQPASHGGHPEAAHTDTHGTPPGGGSECQAALDRADADDMFDLDLAFAATAFLSLVAIAWWSADARARASHDLRARDWLPVSAAACAAMVSIALAGASYFAVRAFHARELPKPLWNIPWHAMAWVWCGMVALGLLVMWVSALAGFWNRLGDTARPGPAEPRPDERPDAWRLWMSILAVGALPAFGLLFEGRFALLLAVLLVAVFGVFAGMAMLHAARDEAAMPARA